MGVTWDHGPDSSTLRKLTEVIICNKVKDAEKGNVSMFLDTVTINS